MPQQFAGTCRDAGFAALLARDVFAEVARAESGLLLRRTRMKYLHRRRFSSALVHDSNLAEGFFVALIAALRCLRSAIALSVAAFFIQRMNKHRSQKTAAGISPASHGALAGVDKANYLSQMSHVSLPRVLCSPKLCCAMQCQAVCDVSACQSKGKQSKGKQRKGKQRQRKAQQSKAKQSKAKQSKAQQSKAQQSKAKRSKAKQRKAEQRQSKAKQTQNRGKQSKACHMLPPGARVTCYPRARVFNTCYPCLALALALALSLLLFFLVKVETLIGVAQGSLQLPRLLRRLISLILRRLCLLRLLRRLLL